MLAGTAPLGVASRVWDRCLLEGIGPLVSITLALLSAVTILIRENCCSSLIWQRNLLHTHLYMTSKTEWCCNLRGLEIIE